jgi:hypothetical protein
MGGGTVTAPQSTGYTNSATLYPAFWIKCSSGTFSIVESGTGAGDWDVACATIGGTWTFINSASHAAVTQNTAWQSSGTGTIDLQISGADAEWWQPTLCETNGISTIGTGSAAVDTGDIAFTIANGSNQYWNTGDTVTQALDEVDGTCWVTGTTLRMSGAAGSECTGYWGLNKVER